MRRQLSSLLISPSLAFILSVWCSTDAAIQSSAERAVSIAWVSLPLKKDEVELEVWIYTFEIDLLHKRRWPTGDNHIRKPENTSGSQKTQQEARKHNRKPENTTGSVGTRAADAGINVPTVRLSVMIFKTRNTTYPWEHVWMIRMFQVWTAAWLFLLDGTE